MACHLSRSVPKVNAALPRKSAEIVAFPRVALPLPEQDFVAALGRMIRVAFPGPSQHAVALAAARVLGCSPDTVERILQGATSRVDGRLAFAVLTVWSARNPGGFDLGHGLAVRVTLAAQAGGVL